MFVSLSDPRQSDLEVGACLCASKQGLLKVAIDNARAQEKQVQLERSELKMELYRERELRETLERQLDMEQRSRGRTTLPSNHHA